MPTKSKEADKLAEVRPIPWKSTPSGSHSSPLSRRALLRQILEVGAVCVSSARTDLCRGCRETGIPTATIKTPTLARYNYRPSHAIKPGFAGVISSPSLRHDDVPKKCRNHFPSLSYWLSRSSRLPLRRRNRMLLRFPIRFSFHQYPVGSLRQMPSQSRAIIQYSMGHEQCSV